jgi:hypothetical protein
MDIEYEAAFVEVEHGLMRERLASLGAVLVRPEYLQRRKNFTLPAGSAVERINNHTPRIVFGEENSFIV